MNPAEHSLNKKRNSFNSIPRLPWKITHEEILDDMKNIPANGARFLQATAVLGSLLIGVPDTLHAQVQVNSKGELSILKNNTIEKVIAADQMQHDDIFKRMDPIEYELASKIDQKKGRLESNYQLNLDDLKHLTWNIFHEARGEGREGMLGVLLTVLERTRSGNFSNSIPGVIYKSKQFSWTFDNKDNFPLPASENTTDQKTFSALDFEKIIFIRNLLQEFTIGKNIDTIIKNIKDELNLPHDKKILFYKKNSPEWDENTENNKLSTSTRQLFKGLLKIKSIKNHNFYSFK